MHDTTTTTPPLDAVRRDTIACGPLQLHRIRVGPPPSAPTVARLAVLHGYGDHAGRFVHFMRWLADRGVACHAVDFRGHGRSSGRRAHVSRWEEYLDDLAAFLATEELATTSAEAPPLFVLGHSHGGLVAAAAVIRRRLTAAACRGVILSSPYLALKMPVPLHKLVLGHLGSWLFPTLAIESGVRNQPLSRDPEMNADTERDTLCHGVATPRWFKTATAAQAEVRHRATDFTLPLLMLIPTADTVADAAASEQFFDHCSSRDKTVKFYEGFRHEILRELGRERAFEDIISWIRTRQ